MWEWSVCASTDLCVRQNRQRHWLSMAGWQWVRMRTEEVPVGAPAIHMLLKAFFIWKRKKYKTTKKSDATMSNEFHENEKKYIKWIDVVRKAVFFLIKSIMTSWWWFIFYKHANANRLLMSVLKGGNFIESYSFNRAISSVWVAFAGL